MQICEDDLKFVSTLGRGASSVVFKALMVKSHESTSTNNEQTFVAVKKINVAEKVRPHSETTINATVLI